MSAFPTIRNVACRYCDAGEHEECRTSSGGPVRDGVHRSRWDALSSQRLHRRCIVRICEDDPSFNLKAGEEYEAITYWLDPGAKVSLLARLPDGWDPECNLYWHQGEFVGWAA